MAALEGKWLVLSGCVQVDAGKPLIIAACLDWDGLDQADFLMRDRTHGAPQTPLKNRRGRGTGMHADGRSRGHIQ
jgi:hypothetical protein